MVESRKLSLQGSTIRWQQKAKKESESSALFWGGLHFLLRRSKGLLSALYVNNRSFSSSLFYSKEFSGLGKMGVICWPEIDHFSHQLGVVISALFFFWFYSIKPPSDSSGTRTRNTKCHFGEREFYLICKCLWWVHTSSVTPICI